MSFYQNQDDARKKTAVLVVYFLLAVIAIVALVNLSVYVIAFLSSTHKFSWQQWLQSPFSWFIALLTLAVIGGGSLLRMAKLSKGGISVAMMSGATPIDPATSDSKERRLLNVVEEMAIASGTSIPRVFVMKEELGINAFVAGTEPRNTIVAVTQGALEKLNRDELQGVIGHEFSHILNGDMKLNLKLMGILAGILLIGQLGEFLLRGTTRSSYHRSHHRSSTGKSEAQLIPLGLALMVIGYVGLFFGRLIKAAISRQREYLADASSVQFTRNPEGIASALYAIHHYSGHALLFNRHAEDMSHMCFGTAVKHKLNGMLATHPPIEQRVRSIDEQLWPRLKARFRNRTLESGEHSTAIHAPQTNTDSTLGFAPTANLTEPQPVNCNNVKSSVGTLSPEHQVYAHELHTAMPDSLKRFAHNEQAENIVYALLMQEDRNNQAALSAIATTNGNAIEALANEISNTDPRFRLPLLDMALATLQQKTPEQGKQIVENSITIIKSDQRITLSEFVYCFLIQQSLIEQKQKIRTIKSFQQAESELAALFSVIVQSSGDSEEKQLQNFTQIMGYFSKRDFSELLKQPPSPKLLNRALLRLSQLSPLLKQPVVDSCVDCILHDGKAVLKEIELLRAVCEAMNCPMPPILLD